jgi:RNA polymerase sigma-70 factor (ECF subfamily)
MALAESVESWMNDDFSRAELGQAPDQFIEGKPAGYQGQVRAADSSISARFDAEAIPHMNDVFRTATRMLADRSRAEDVVQEVFLQAWKSFVRFEAGTNCRAWLFKILFHCVNHHRRKWFRFPLLKETEEFVEANLSYTPPVPEHLTDEDILSALDRIPADFRAAVLLVDVEEFAYKEAAEILSVPVGTVMSRLSRGRKQLREQLAEVAKSYGIGKVQRGQAS